MLPLLSWFKKHFIPHAGNDHRPHILREHNIRGIVAVVILLELFTFLIPTLTHLNMTGGMAAVLPAVLDDLTNVERKEQNLPTLAVSPILNQAAEMKAQDMAAKGYFAHTSPEGKTPWYWLDAAGYNYQYAGENLAINFSDSKDVTDAWMNSPTHRANIVKGNYTEVGTGVATGTYEGRETIFVAQVYANPLPIAVTQTPVEQTVPTAPVAKEVKKPAPKLAPKVAVAPKPTSILGAEQIPTNTSIKGTPVEPVQQSTILQKLVASPRNTMNVVLYIVFAVIGLALILNIVIKIRHHHLDLITNGLVVMALVGAIFTGNYYATHRSMVVATSLDYTSATR